MKATTTQVYNLITSENFLNIKHKLTQKTKEQNWVIPDRQEYSYHELIDDLPDSIDMIRQNIEDTTFDALPYSVRHGIFNTINQINSYLQNIYANHQQFANLQDLTQTLKTLIRSNRLDFEAKRIPRYKEKIKEYKELIVELQELNSMLDATRTKKDELDEVLETAKKNSCRVSGLCFGS